MATFRSRLAALLLAVLLTLSASCQALELDNKGPCSVEVYVPPICQVCKCPTIECIHAPCPQPSCFCPALCRFVPGVVIVKGGKTMLMVEKTEFPLAFLTIEKGKDAYVVSARDLKVIGFESRLVVTGRACGKGKLAGIEVLVLFPSSYSGSKYICLLLGERYAT